MQKFIAVVNQKMDEDEISKLLRAGVSGAIFSISHQNYPAAARLVELVQSLARKYNCHVSIIQDVSDMENPLDLEFGNRIGAHWMMTDKPEHVKLSNGLNKLAKVIYKGQSLPNDVRIDGIMSNGFIDPDVSTLDKKMQIKHILFPHEKQSILDSLIDIAHHSKLGAIAVSDLDHAKGLVWRRPNKIKIVYAPANRSLADQASIYPRIHTVYGGGNVVKDIKSSGLMGKKDKVLDATDINHVAFI